MIIRKKVLSGAIATAPAPKKPAPVKPGGKVILTTPTPDDEDEASSIIAPEKPELIAPAKPKLALPQPKSFVAEGSEIGEVMKEVNSAFGNDVARFMNASRRFEPRIRTGIFTLDLAMAGGWMTSRGHMLYGERSSGKTTTAMMTAVEAQRMYPDMVVAWIDVEGTFDRTWFEKLGGDSSRLLLVEPETGEQAVDIAHAMLLSKEVSVLVTDSIAMLTPMKELEDSSEDTMPGLHARLIGKYIRKTNNAMLKERHRGHRPINLFINQWRMKIGLVFGDPRVLPGGKALEFATSTQVETKNKEHINDKGDVEYNEHNFKITKEKTGAGRIREIKFKLVRDPDYNRGLPEGYIDQMKSMLEFGTRVGVVEGKYTIHGFGKYRSSADATDFFLTDSEAYARLQAVIIDKYRAMWGLPVVGD